MCLSYYFPLKKIIHFRQSSVKNQTPNTPIRSVFHHFSLPGLETAVETHGCGWDPYCPWTLWSVVGSRDTDKAQGAVQAAA